MCGQGNCGCSCDTEEELSQEDQKALLEEREKILEAKLATVRHMKDSLKNKGDSDKK